MATATIRRPRRKLYARHPWPSWFARQRFTLVRWQDYAGMTHAFAQSVRNMAASRAYRLRVSISFQEEPEGIAVEVTGKLPRRK
jgi:hypothetical protein